MQVLLCGSREWAHRTAPALVRAGLETGYLRPEEPTRATPGAVVIVEAGTLEIGALRQLAAACTLIYALDRPDLAAARQARWAGALEAVVLPDEAGQLPQILQQGRHAGRPSGGVIVFTSPKDGDGASLVAAGLALSLAHRGEETALVDLHLPFGDQEALLQIEPAHSIIDLHDYTTHLEAAQVEQVATPHPSGLAVVCAPAGRLHQEDRLPAGMTGAMIEAAAARYRWVVVDAPAHADHLPVLAERAARLLLVVAPDPYSIRHAYYLLGRMAPPAGVCGVVVNQVSPRSPFAPAEVARRLGLPLLGEVPLDPALAYRRQIGEAIVQGGRKPGTPGEASLRKLTQALAAGVGR